MNRDVIGLGEGQSYPPQAFGPSAPPPPPYVTVFEGYYYDYDLDYAYGPNFGFRYYGGFTAATTRGQPFIRATNPARERIAAKYRQSASTIRKPRQLPDIIAPSRRP